MLTNTFSMVIKSCTFGNVVEVIIERYSGSLTIFISDHEICMPLIDLHCNPTLGNTISSLINNSIISMAESIIEAHNGKFTVESSIQGSSYRISLPTESSIKRPREDQQQTSLKEKRLRLLVAEDNIMNQKLLHRILQKRGHLVDIASDGVEAWELFEKNGGHSYYDALLTDEEMPKMVGSQVVNRIRNIEKEHNNSLKLPIISISGYTSEEHLGKMRSCGVDICISKPFQTNSLIDTVETITQLDKNKLCTYDQ